ncbi:hypothetical protein [Acinetobacter stercoris]|uniref:DUF3168 domain-containing protein n=1 Tax=Acinetobacter stercoris TaxID=2126983 RepID=A0A2U3MV24_9GAMM|nr:hypothetical protein [Acinetobacter stercoris]SPL69149.1 hypothetical protein KPC_0327 [Acinetobacter stercoris]
MMTHTQAREAFMRLIDSFDYLDQSMIFTQNQKQPSQPFEPPDQGLWCRVVVRNAPSFISCMADEPRTRTVGNLIIQCFDRLGNDTIELSKLGDAWIKHLQFKQVDQLTIMTGSVIDVGEAEDFYQFNVIFEYRIN